MTPLQSMWVQRTYSIQAYTGYALRATGYGDLYVESAAKHDTVGWLVAWLGGTSLFIFEGVW